MYKNYSGDILFNYNKLSVIVMYLINSGTILAPKKYI